MSPSGYRVSRRSTLRVRSVSDPGHPYFSPPSTVRWPAPARRKTDPIPTPAVLQQEQQQPERSPSRVPADDSAPGSVLARIQTGDPPGSTLSSSPQASARSTSSPRSIHNHTSSRQDSVPGTQQGYLYKDLPPPPPAMPIANDPAFDEGATAHPQGISAHQQHSFPEPRPNVDRQPSRHTMRRVQASGQPVTTTPPLRHTSRSSSNAHRPTHHHSTTHHSHQSTRQHTRSRSRSRSRPPSPQPAYHRHGSSSSYLEGSDDPRNYMARTPPPHLSSTPRPEYDRPVPSRTHTRSSLHHRPHAQVDPEIAPAHHLHKPQEPPHHVPDPTHISDVYPMPGLHSGANDTQTRYVRMLLALDDIPNLYNLLASFFTWILLAGFILFPGTFASWKDAPSGSTQNEIANLINNVALLVIAWLCTGIGGFGMIWLWWRWQNNYVWIVNRIFVPGCLNSLAGVISTLTNVYGTQSGTFSTTAKSTIIVTGALTVICGILVGVYQFGMIRNLKKEHAQLVGVEKAGKHGEGILGPRKSKKREASLESG